MTETQKTQLREQVKRAAEVLWRSWPLRSFVYRNALEGFEHLPFEEATRQGWNLLRVRSFLPAQTYRKLYGEGVISETTLRTALKRKVSGDRPLTLGGRSVDPVEVLWIHLLWGIEGLDPLLFQWKTVNEKLLSRFRAEVPSEKRVQTEEAHLGQLWRQILRKTQDDTRKSEDPLPLDTPGVPMPGDWPPTTPGLTLAEWIDLSWDLKLTEKINREMISWCSVFLDEGLSAYGMPDRDQGFYSTWRDMAPRKNTGWSLGIRDFSAKIHRLPPTSEAALTGCLDRMGIPESSREGYLRRHLAQLPGWAGFIKWRGNEPDYPMQGNFPITLVDYLALRLFYESEFVGSTCREKWEIEGTYGDIQSHFQKNSGAASLLLKGEGQKPKGDAVSGKSWRVFQLAQFLGLKPEEIGNIRSEEINDLLAHLDQFPPEDHGAVWLSALEQSYQAKLLPKLLRGGAGRSGGNPESRPLAQAFFCIDARSEGLRRHLEALGPYETFGFAGFFGVPICFRPYGVEEDYLLCPALFKPKNRVAEVPRPEHREQTRRFEVQKQWADSGHELFHDLKANNLSAFPLIDFLAPWFGLRLTGKTLLPGWTRRFKDRFLSLLPPAPATELRLDPPALKETHGNLPDFGFNQDEQTDILESALRVVGLTHQFARIVLFCAHGSRTENNPYAAAYDCGACGGRHGGPNARALCVIANRAEIRTRLAQRGIKIPKDTVFIAGEHNTTTDEIELLDQADIPASHREDTADFLRTLALAGQSQAQERLTRLPGAPGSLSPSAAQVHAKRRSGDWSEIRPEWGLSKNAAFIIGRRSLTRDVNLEGRVFLNSYDSAQDESGEALETIMTGPLLVVQTISMEYYFSSTDQWNYGAGSKVLHNVTAGIGVMLGRESDLVPGLPLQSVNNGREINHEPMRPLVIIEAPRERVLKIVARHTRLQNLMANQWINLVVLEPSDLSYYEYRPGGSMEPILDAAEEVA